MALSRLSLSDFRSYADAVIAPGPGLVVLTGENGAGKTNVLEAVSLLSPGRGLRGASLAEMARSGGSGGFAVAARLPEVEIGTGTLAGTRSGGRSGSTALQPRPRRFRNGFPSCG
jgi:DNA replication and repair protein RecF